MPGTLNVRLPRPLERGSSWRYMRAAEISPDWEAQSGQAGYFLVAVTIADRYRASPFKQMSTEMPNTPPIRSSS